MVAEITMCQPGKAPGERQIRIEGNSAIVERPSLFGALAQKAAHMPREGHCPSVSDIQPHRAFSQLRSTRGRGARIERPTLTDQYQIQIREPCVRAGII